MRGRRVLFLQKEVKTMEKIDTMEFIRQKLPKEELLAQLAEECAELGKAALKLRRVYSGKNPTPVKGSEAYSNLLEEIADVTLCLEVLELNGSEVRSELQKTMNEKLERWCKRLREMKCPVCDRLIPSFLRECPNCRVSQFDPDDFMGEYEDENNW